MALPIRLSASLRLMSRLSVRAAACRLIRVSSSSAWAAAGINRQMAASVVIKNCFHEFMHMHSVCFTAV